MIVHGICYLMRNDKTACEEEREMLSFHWSKGILFLRQDTHFLSFCLFFFLHVPQPPILILQNNVTILNIISDHKDHKRQVLHLHCTCCCVLQMAFCLHEFLVWSYEVKTLSMVNLRSLIQVLRWWRNSCISGTVFQSDVMGHVFLVLSVPRTNCHEKKSADILIRLFIAQRQ